jgi:hypothetical protein
VTRRCAGDAAWRAKRVDLWKDRGGGGTPPPPAMTLSPVTITVKQAAVALSQRGSAEYKVQWKVAFIEGYNLTEPPWGHSVAAAGALPTMTSAPSGWSDGAAQNHTLRVNYDDIAGTPQTQVGTP